MHRTSPAALAALPALAGSAPSRDAGAEPVARCPTEWSGEGEAEAVTVGTALRQGISRVSACRTLVRP